MADINPPGFLVERGKIHEFANAILDDHPHYHDEVKAKADGLPTVVAPPTYSSTSSYFLPRAGGGIEGLDLRFVLHGGQEWIFERPIVAGDVLTAEPGPSKSYEKEGKRGGTMKFVETELLFKDAKGQVVMRTRNTLIQTGQVVQS